MTAVATKTYWEEHGKHQALYDEMYNRLVPSHGPALTRAGEVLRAISKMYYRYFNDGDTCHSCDSSARSAFTFLQGQEFTPKIHDLLDQLKAERGERKYRRILEQLTDALIVWVSKQKDEPNDLDYLKR